MRQLILGPWAALDPLALVSGRRALVPNQRAARALGVAFDSLEREALARLRRAPYAIARPLQAQRLMRETAADCLGAEDPAGTARALMPVVRMVLRAGVDLARIEAEGPPRAARIAHCAREYQARLRQAGWLDTAEALRHAATLGAPKQPVLVAGYPRLGADERELIEAIAGDGSVVLLPYLPHAQYADNLEAARFFEAHGWQVEITEAEAPAQPLEGLLRPGLERDALAFADMEAEARGVLGRVKALLAEGVAADRIALVARQDDFYGPLLLDVAHEYQVPLRALYGVPLTRTRLGSWLALVLEAGLHGLPFEGTFRLLAHPLSPGLPPEQRALARQRHPAGEVAWREIGVDLSGLAWPEADTRANWVRAVRELIRELGVRRQAARWPREALACHALLEQLAPLAEPEGEALSRAAFVQELLDTLDLVAVPAHPGRGGVELHTPLSLYGARYEHVFVLGMAENVLPAPVADSPVLDFHERRALAELGVGLEDAAGAARREFLSFAALMQVPTQRLTLSYPRLLGDRAALPSAYFKGLGLKPEEAGVGAIASLNEARRVWISREAVSVEDPTLPLVRHALEVEITREGDGQADDYDGVVGAPLDPDERIFSASQLVTLGQCGFKWFAHYVLGLAEPDEFEEELSPAARGDLYHKALELAVGRARGAEPFVPAVLDALDAAFAQAEAELDVARLPAWPQRREEHLDKLRQAVASPHFLEAGAEVLGTETAFRGTWHGLAVRGRVDRIDRTAEGLELIDYKTSSKPPDGAQDAAGYAKLDIQLPLYVQAAAPALYPNEPVQGARYYSLTKGRTLKVAKPDEGLADFAERVKGMLRDGAYAVAPDKQLKACTYCEFDLVCRKGPRLSRKESHA